MAIPVALRDTIQGGRRTYRSAGPPLPLLLTSCVVAIGILLPLAYLIMRAAGAGDEIWRLLLRPRSAIILFNSVALASAVTLSTIAIAVPLAWLVVRSDLPLRRLWTSLLVVPLAVPSYVGGFVLIGALGPRGMLQRLLAPLGVERLPEIYGFPGAWLALTLFTYPYVFLVVRAALGGMDRTLEEASRSLGQSSWLTFWKITFPQLRPAMAAGGLLVALYTLSDFGAVSLLQFDLIHAHHLRPLSRLFRPAPRCRSRTRACVYNAAHSRSRALEPGTRLLPKRRPHRDAATAPHGSREVADTGHSALQHRCLIRSCPARAHRWLLAAP